MKFITYAIVGALGTFVHFSTLIILVEYFKFNPVISSLIGFIFTVILSFFLNKRYTFKVRSKENSSYFLRYTTVSIVGFIINFLIMYFTVTMLTFHYFIGQTIVVIIIPVINFLLNNYWTFSSKE